MKKAADLKTNNAGLSILELVVVIAILSIIGVTLFLSTSVATDRHVTSCAGKISSALEQTRNLTLGKQSGYINFWVDATGEVLAQVYIDGSPYSDQISIGHKGLTVEFVYVNPLNGAMVVRKALDSGGAQIEFSRSTGGVKSYSQDSVSYSPGSHMLKTIVVTNGHKTSNVTIDLYTGRVDVS